MRHNISTFDRISLIRKNIMKKLVIVIFLLGLLTGYSSCGNKVVESPIPNVSFDITLNLNLPLYTELLHPMGGIVYVDNVGSKGIAILRISQDQFVVYDRHCSYNVDEGCRVFIDPENIASLKDSLCCSSSFNMLNNGLPDSGPASLSLKPYNYTFNGSNLRVYN
jgi:hypothetical protein